MMGLRWLLKRFGAFPNDYYNYLKDRKVAYRKRKENLLNCITETYHERKSTPGYRLMAALLKNKGIRISPTTYNRLINSGPMYRNIYCSSPTSDAGHNSCSVYFYKVRVTRHKNQIVFVTRRTLSYDNLSRISALNTHTILL